MNYFNGLPIELNTLITAYTSPKDYDNIIKSDIISKLDYHQLFKLQFRKNYKQEIINYDVKEIYIGFIYIINHFYAAYNFGSIYRGLGSIYIDEDKYELPKKPSVILRENFIKLYPNILKYMGINKILYLDDIELSIIWSK